MNKGIKINFPYPKILTHPHIPKPMHGVNPRNIGGREWWYKVRHQVYAKYNYRCLACGVHKSEAKKNKWLEAHENWDIDYKNGVCIIDSIQPLCHYCHQFIHSGYLSIRQDISIREKKEILQHGFDVLKGTGLEVFEFTLKFAELLGVNTHGLKYYKLPKSNLGWGDWHLIYGNKKYYSNFDSYEDWKNHFNN